MSKPAEHMCIVLCCNGGKLCKIVSQSLRRHDDLTRDARAALALADRTSVRTRTEQTEKEEVTKQLDAACRELDSQRNQFDRFLLAIDSQPGADFKLLHQRIRRECFRLCPFNRDLDAKQLFTKPLPALALREDFTRKVLDHQVVIAQGDTGSGKSTQLPQYVAELLPGKICVTQPRKVSAIELAARVAYEYSAGAKEYCDTRTQSAKKDSKAVKFSSSVRNEPADRITFLTESTLLEHLLESASDAKASTLPWQVVILDEAHERSIQMDLLLGLLKARASDDRNFRLIVTSATLDAEKFQRYFSPPQKQITCPLVRIPGRMFPVKITYAPPPDSQDLLKAAVQRAWKHHCDPDFIGDILVFLSGQDEAERAVKDFEFLRARQPASRKALVLPLYGKLQPEDQRLVFVKPPEGTRKIVFSTNVAETGVTVDGVRLVIDTGLCKEYTFDNKRNMAVLALVPISQSSATQRKGRAGRTSSGECVRLYSQEDFDKMRTGVVPELQRASLSLTILTLLCRGIDVNGFDFIDRPGSEDVAAATQELQMLDAVVVNQRSSQRLGLTDFGRFAAKFQMDVKLARILWVGIQKRQWDWAATMAALLTTECNVFYRAGDQKKKEAADCTHQALLASLGCEPLDGDVMASLRVFYKWHTLDEWWAAEGQAKSSVASEQGDDHDTTPLDSVQNPFEQVEQADGLSGGSGSLLTAANLAALDAEAEPESNLSRLLGNIGGAALGFFSKQEAKALALDKLDAGLEADHEDVASATAGNGYDEDAGDDVASQASDSSLASGNSSLAPGRSRSPSPGPGKTPPMNSKKKTQLQGKWAWKHSLNHKTLNMASKERQAIIAKLQEFKLWGTQDTVALNQRDTHALFFAGYFLNVAQRRQQQSYFVATSSLNAYLSSGSILKDTQTEWLCFLKVMKTSKSFLQVASPIANLAHFTTQLVPAAAQSAFSKRVQASSSECKSLGALTNSVVRLLFGKRYVDKAALERELQVDLEVVSTESKLQEVRLWAAPGRMAAAFAQLQARMAACISQLELEVFEKVMIGRTRAVFGAGAKVQRLLLGNEFVRVNFLNLPVSKTLPDLRAWLQAARPHGLGRRATSITAAQLEPTQDGGRQFGWAVFSSPQEAKACMEAAEDFLLDGKTMLICKPGGAPGVSHAEVSNVDMRVSWAVAPSAGCGGVEFATAAEANRALAGEGKVVFPDRKSPFYRQEGDRAQVKQLGVQAAHAFSSGNKADAKILSNLKKTLESQSREYYEVDAQTEDGKEASPRFKVNVKDLPTNQDEHDLRTRFSKYGTVTSAYVRRDPTLPAVQQGDEKLDMALSLLRSLVFSGSSKDIISHTVFPGDKSPYRAYMQVRFDLVSAAQTCLANIRRHQELSSLRFQGQLVRAEVKLSHRCRLHADIHRSLAVQFRAIETQAVARGVSVMKYTQGEGKVRWTVLNVEATLDAGARDADLLEAFYVTKTAINSLLRHRLFEHPNGHLLFSHKGRRYMEWLSEQKTGFIHWQHNSVRLYGTKAHMQVLERFLTDFLDDISRDLVTTTLYIDRKSIRAAAKVLVKLRQSAGILSCSLGGSALELICSDAEGLHAAKEFLQSERIRFRASPGPESKAGANAGECALCLEPVEEPSYTLVLCGHTFCKDCIEPQMTAADKFPVCCPKEGCTRPLAWRDVESICDAKALTAITNASYQSFRCANLKLFPNCMGLNCSQVFHKDDQHAFCDQCNTDYCIPCCSRRGAATPAHPGRTCAQQEGALKHDALFEQLFTSGKYAKCPNSNCRIPIEKNDGCYHMHCKTCDTHFCWGCMGIFGGNMANCTCRKDGPTGAWGGQDPACLYVYHHMGHCKRPVHS